MDKKILLEAVQKIVQKEVDKRINKRMKTIKRQMLKEIKPLLKEYMEDRSKKTDVEVDPFEQATQLLENERRQGKSSQVEEPTPSNKQDQRVFSKDPVLNEVLSQTQPFSPEERKATGAGSSKSILDNLPEFSESKSTMINEASGNPDDFEEWPTMKHNMKPQPQGGIETGMSGAEQVKQSMRAAMEAEFQPSGGGKGNKSGLGVNTGLSGLDRILNRDNSELVKRFNKKGK